MASAATSRQPLGRGSLWLRHRRAITAVLAVLVAAAFARYVLPHIVGLGPTLSRLRQGHILWLAVGVALEACSVILVALSMLFANQPVTELLQRRAEGSTGRAAKWWHRLAAAPRAVHAGLLSARAMIRRRDRCLLGAMAYWGFDIGALWASYRAFGHSPTGAVLVIGYYVGTAGNVRPLPRGIGGVEAGMIGAFVGFRVRASLATVAMLGYRTISYWLPTLPGAVAYMRLRHTAEPPPPEAE